MKFIKTVQYHGATNDMLYQLCDCTVFSMWFAKTAQYHDATNKSCCLLPSWYFPWISQIRLDTKMLQITSGIPFFFAVFPMKITKTARYHDAANNRFYLHFSRHLPWNSSKRLSTTTLQMTTSSHFSYHFPWKSPVRLSTVMLQITDRYLHSSSYFPSNSAKRISTMMLQMTDVIWFFQWFSTQFTKAAQ